MTASPHVARTASARASRADHRKVAFRVAQGRPSNSVDSVGIGKRRYERRRGNLPPIGSVVLRDQRQPLSPPSRRVPCVPPSGRPAGADARSGRTARTTRRRAVRPPRTPAKRRKARYTVRGAFPRRRTGSLFIAAVGLRVLPLDQVCAPAACRLSDCEGVDARRDSPTRRHGLALKCMAKADPLELYRRVGSGDRILDSSRAPPRRRRSPGARPPSRRPSTPGAAGN